MLERTIFSIDNYEDIHNLAKFTRLMDTKHVEGKLKGPVVPCVGQWHGVIEYSFMCTSKDFEEFVKPFGCVQEQECFLIVPGDVRQPCLLHWTKRNIFQPAGRMVEVKPDVLSSLQGWTYNTATQRYFTLEK